MKRVHVPAQNSSSSVQMFPYDISGKSEGYLLDTLRCCAVNISANKWPPPPHYKCMFPDRYPTDKIH